MKHLQKFSHYLLVALVAVSIASCKKDKGPKLPDPEPKLLSFGFYADDNEGVLFRDYVVSQVNGTTVQIDLPRDADRRNLVARYTTTDNATVTVAGTLQQSGVSKVNFTTPVDYIVTEGNINARYTISIGNAPDFVWSRGGAYTEKLASSFAMELHPQTGAPYFIYILSNSETALRTGNVVKYENGAFAAVGTPLTEGRVGTHMDLAFDKDGKLYVTYPDYATTPAQSPMVKTLNGNTWANVGTNPVFPALVTFTTLGINPANNQPILVSYVDDRNYTLPRRATTVSMFNGTTWQLNNRLADRPDTQVGGIMKSKTVGDTFYVGVYNNNVGAPHAYSVYTFKNGTWTTIIDQFYEEGAAGLNLRDFDMDVDQEGNIYICASDNASGQYRPRVKKYTAATQTWSQIGSPVEFDQPSTRHYAMAVAPNGVVHVMYRNNQNQATVVAFDRETQDWGTPKVLETAPTRTTFVDIKFAADGTGYAAFVSESDNIVVYKYDVPTSN